MQDYDKNKESSYLKYCDVNNLYDWAMSQMLQVNNFEWRKGTSQFNEDFIKNNNEESDGRCFLEVDVQYSEKLHKFHNDLSFLPERMKKSKSLLLIYMIKLNVSIQIRNLKQALNQGLILKKVHNFKLKSSS